MEGGEDWLYRPIMRGMVGFDAVLDHRYDLADFVQMNEALDVESENQIRLRNWADEKAKDESRRAARKRG